MATRPPDPAVGRRSGSRNQPCPPGRSSASVPRGRFHREPTPGAGPPSFALRAPAGVAARASRVPCSRARAIKGADHERQDGPGARRRDRPRRSRRGLGPVGDTRAVSNVRSLDGSGNNLAHPTWGQAGTQYLRVAPANYADGIKTPVGGPPTRYVSNRIFNDVAQNLFSENDVTQWGFAWGQFMDHTFGLRQEVGGENAPIAFDAARPARGVPQRLRRDRLHAHAGRARHRCRRGPCASRSTPSAATSTRFERLRRHDRRGSSGCARGRSTGPMSNNGATLLLAATACCRAATPRQRRDRAGDGARWAG